MNQRLSRKRLPVWGYPIVVAGAVVTYFVVGQVLHSPMFLNDLDLFLTSPEARASADFERVGPYIVLLIPAILGGFGTREILTRILGGLDRGEELSKIAWAVGGLLLSFLVLVLVAFFSGGRGRR